LKSTETTPPVLQTNALTSISAISAR